MTTQSVAASVAATRAWIDRTHLESTWERIVRWALVGSAVLTGYGYLTNPAGLGSRPSYEYIDKLGVPWWGWGSVFLLQAALLACPFRIRLAGYYCGFLMCGYLAVGFWMAVAFSDSVIIQAPSNLTCLAIIHVAGAREYVWRRAMAARGL